MNPKLTKLAADNGMKLKELLDLLQDAMTILHQDQASESAMTVKGLLCEQGGLSRSDIEAMRKEIKPNQAKDLEKGFYHRALEAHDHYEAAALSGSTEAMYRLSMLEDENGEPVAEYDKRKHWLTEAADRRYEPAALQLRKVEAELEALMGVEIDELYGEEYLREELVRGKPQARYELFGYLLRQDQQAEAKALLEPVLGQEAKANLLWATQFDPTSETNTQLLRQAVTLGEDVMAQCEARWELARMLFRRGDATEEAIGHLTEIDRIADTQPAGTKVQFWQRLKLNRLASNTQFRLAHIYDRGVLVERDAAKARNLYLKCNSHNSLFRAAIMTLRGDGCPVDREEAGELLRRAKNVNASSWASVAWNVGWENKKCWWQADETTYSISVSKAPAKPRLYALDESDIDLLLADNPNWQAAASDPVRAAPVEDLRGLLSGTARGFLSKLNRARGQLDVRAGHFETEEALRLLREVEQQYQEMDRPSAEKHFSASFMRRLQGEIGEALQESVRMQAAEAARRTQLSFLSHTLSNASAGAQDTIRRAARLLGTVQADKPETLRRAMERLSGQIASLALIETLVASFKLYASDPDRVRESWDNEQAGDIAFVRVLALALRQVLTRLFTLPGHALDLRRLLPESGEVLAQEFVADIMVLDLESDAEAARLIAWVRDKLPFLELRIEDDASLRFAQGGARFVVVFAVLAEILTNAMKYASEVPITLVCELTERRLNVACRNRVQARPLQALDSGGTGIAFLREICRIVGADIQDSLNESGQFEVVFTAKA